MDRDDLGTDTDRLVWEPHMLKRVRKRPTDAIREAREWRTVHLDPVRAPWLHSERAYRRGAVTFAGGIPRGERWLRAALLVGGAVLVVRIVLGLVLR